MRCSGVAWWLAPPHRSGPPGAGKTILANQLAHNHVRDGGRVLVATLLSESHERLFQYLSTLAFFDQGLIGDQIQFVSAFDTLEQEGLEAGCACCARKSPGKRPAC